MLEYQGRSNEATGGQRACRQQTRNTALACFEGGASTESYTLLFLCARALRAMYRHEARMNVERQLSPQTIEHCKSDLGGLQLETGHKVKK